MKHCGGNLILGLFGLIMLVCASVKSEDTGAGKRIHDFGEITEGDMPKHTFSFENTSDSAIKILSIRIPCGCAKSNLDKESLNPGETAQFAIEFNSKGRRGNSENSIYLITDSKSLPLVKYIVKARIKPRPEAVCLAPSKINAGVFAPEETKTISFDVENKGDAELVLSKGADDSFTIASDDLPVTIPPGTKKSVRAVVTASAAHGDFKFNLKFKTNDVRKPELWIPICGDVGEKTSDNK